MMAKKGASWSKALKYYAGVIKETTSYLIHERILGNENTLDFKEMQADLGKALKRRREILNKMGTKYDHQVMHDVPVFYWDAPQNEW